MRIKTRLYLIALLAAALPLGMGYAQTPSPVGSKASPFGEGSNDSRLKPTGKPGINHDSTLIGNGTSDSPLGVAEPLYLNAEPGTNNAVITGDSTVGSGNGVLGAANTGIGVYGFTNSGIGVYGFSNSGLAGKFFGNAQVTGTLSKAGGSFKIDHPLDPENKYLYHSFVESPDMMNVYNGNITTDATGEAMIELPAYFESLNRDFRYQLTAIGQFAQAIVASEIEGNHFKIKTDKPNVKVSWLVTGVRRDAWAEKHRIKVEQDKVQSERGLYLHPEVFNQPEDRGVEWARNQELSDQTNQRRNDR